jgi:uncharacterized protein YjiS (DUF1127 family)
MAIVEDTYQNHLALSSSPNTILSTQVSGARVIWTEWQTRRRYRRDLKRLLRVGPHMIDDIGLTLEEACREIAKPLWRV